MAWSPGPDTLLGDGGPNFLGGRTGDDVLEGRGGPDSLAGDAGNDDLRSRDDSADTVDCGTETDTATADTLDAVNQDCETVALAPPTGGGGTSGGGTGGGGTGGGGTGGSGAGGAGGGASTGGAATSTDTSSSSATGTPTAPPILPLVPPAVDPRTWVTLNPSGTVGPAGKVTLGSIANPASASATLSGVLPARLAVAAAKKRKPARPVTVASGQVTAADGKTQPLVATVGAKARPALKRHASLKVTATVAVRGADGATATITQSITLKRSAKPRRKKR